MSEAKGTILHYTEKKYNQENGLWYVKNGDYWIPMLTVSKKDVEVGQTMNRWSRMYFNHLKQSKKMLFQELSMSGDLYTRCQEVGERAERIYRDMMNRAEKVHPEINEDLKMTNPQEWASCMSNYNHEVEWFIKEQIIYV